MSSSLPTKIITKNVQFGSPPATSGATPFTTNTLLFEIDTGNVYKFTGGSWSEFSGSAKPETLTNKSIDAADNTITGITNDNFASSALIDYSKLNLANHIVNADISPSAAVPYSKLNLANSIVNADVASAAAIAWTKVSKTGSSISDLANVNITSLADAQVLTYNSASGKWINADPTGGTGGGVSTSAANTWTNTQTFNDQNLLLRNPANTASVTLAAGAQTLGRVFTFPVASSDTIQTIAATQTVSNKTISIDSNTLNHSTTNAAGDVLKGNGTSYQRLARGTANQVLAVNSGGTDVAWTSFNAENTGTATASGNASTTTFNVPHSLGTTPYSAFIQCSSLSQAANPFTFTYDATNIIVVFTTAPASGTNNIKFQWRALA